MTETFQQAALVYSFGRGRADGTAAMKDLLGGKGAGLAEMTNLGIAVPPGFTIAASLCQTWLDTGAFPGRLRRDVDAALQRIEADTGKEFGGHSNPLLVSVRSGSAVSMPGMMDTILNLGLNDLTVEALADRSGNPAFAWDCYRRFVAMYAGVVLELPKAPFDELADAALMAHGVDSVIELPAAALKALVARFKSHAAEAAGRPFPDDPMEQLWGAIAAVFASWNTRRAIDYRRLHDIPDTLGTAVNVVAMVYGNRGDHSGTGVTFSRNPATGEPGLYGEFLAYAQGEDVVSGARTPEPLTVLQRQLPTVYQELERMARTLERHFRDVQDMEFTVEDGRLYMLQTRRAQRTGHAAFRIACDMVREGLISEEEAVARIPPSALDQLLHPTIDPGQTLPLIGCGLPASPGAATGIAVFDADRAVHRAAAGEAVILVRRETSPDDFHGMVAAQAILTARGGMTSHAAVVARGMGTPCVVGAALDIDDRAQVIRWGSQVLAEGDAITLDGSSGQIFAGTAALRIPEMNDDYHRLMGWADAIRPMRIRVNADTAADAHRGRDFGAEGIGLCRTEHMFFEGDRLAMMRELIVARSDQDRDRVLARLLPMQRGDFEALFRAMEGYPVTIRLLDPPLHEFLPHDDDDIEALAEQLDREPGQIRDVIASLHEQNPMLGLRGCRLGIIHPDITRMQVRAVFEAACTVAARKGRVQPEIMVPLVASVVEFRRQALLVREVAEVVFRERQLTVPYLLGTMIELPRAALTADEIAREAQFFSFGTNDLTQTTWGLSRDDSSRFLPHYLASGIIDHDPFQSLDVAGVGRLIRMAAEAGRSTRADLKLGICGEHGGDPASIAFCEGLHMNYVSCSPYRVPIARLAAAQAALADRGTVDRTRATV